MLPAHGMASGTADCIVHTRPRPLFGRSSERKNPLNAQFERQVAHLESRQQQQRCIVITVIPFNVCSDFDSPSLTENGKNHPSSELTSSEEIFEASSSSPIMLFHINVPKESHRRWSHNTSRLLEEKSTITSSIADSDFLVNSLTKPTVNARHAKRKKSKKKSKKQRHRCRKPVDGSEVNCRESNSAAPATDVGDCEDLTLSPKHVGDFDESFSPSSSVKEASEETPESEIDNEYHCSSGASVSSASYCDDIELTRSTATLPGLSGQYNNSNSRYLDEDPNSVFAVSSQETFYAGVSVNCSHDTNTVSICGDDRGPDPCEARECCSSSSGVNRAWLEKSDYSSGVHSHNGVGMCDGSQAVRLCSDTSSDGDFHLVVSRKRARKEKKMLLWKSYRDRASGVTHGRAEKHVGCSSMQRAKELNTEDWSQRQNHVGIVQTPHGAVLKHSAKNFICKPSNICVETQHGVSLKDSKSRASMNHFTNPKGTSGKSASGFNEAQHAGSIKQVSDAVHCRESNYCEMRSNSSSEPTTPNSSNGNCASESGESTAYSVALITQKRGLQDSTRINETSDAISALSAPGFSITEHGWASNMAGPKSIPTDLVVRCSTVQSFDGNYNCQEFCESRMHLVEIIKAVNDACKVQATADIHFVAGYPITDFEKFIYSATPVIDPVPCMKSTNWLRDHVVSNSVCQHDISNASLRRIWEWYEEPGCYGLEVRAFCDLSSKTSISNSSEFFAYFVPYLSAVQLFGWSRKDTDHFDVLNTGSSFGSHPVHAKFNKSFVERNACLSESPFFVENHAELMFEYFEADQPSFRPPLFEKIKELISSANVSDYRILGDPKKLESVKLCDLHPASWFCVAWYPVYRVPRGNLRAAFLTYHSLGKLVPQKCSPDMACGHTCIVSPVVGFQSYNDKGERWFELRDPDFKQSPSDDSRAEILKERLRTLKTVALAMARAVIPKGSGESVNCHPDYEFFRSRCP